MIDVTPAVLSLLLAASPQAEATETAAAQAAAEPVAEQTAAAEAQQEELNEDDKVICRRTSVIGSKFKKRICGTKKEWETLRARAEADTRAFQRRGKGNEPVN